MCLSAPIGTGGDNIGSNGCLECLKRGETLLITQLVVERHRQTPAIQITGKIQQVHLEMGATVTGHRRPYTYIGDAGPGPAIYLGTDQIHPGQRHMATLELDIGRRRIQLTPQLLPMQHPPGNLKRPPLLRQSRHWQAPHVLVYY